MAVIVTSRVELPEHIHNLPVKNKAQQKLDLRNQNPNIHVENLSIVLPESVCSAFAHRLPPGTPEFNVGSIRFKE